MPNNRGQVDDMGNGRTLKLMIIFMHFRCLRISKLASVCLLNVVLFCILVFSPFFWCSVSWACRKVRLSVYRGNLYLTRAHPGMDYRTRSMKVIVNNRGEGGGAKTASQVQTVQTKGLNE